MVNGNLEDFQGMFENCPLYLSLIYIIYPNSEKTERAKVNLTCRETTTETTTPEVNEMIGRMRKNNRAAHAARI